MFDLPRNIKKRRLRQVTITPNESNGQKRLDLKVFFFLRLPDSPGDEEMDMLDLAHDLTETSRLGCQITLTQEMDGLEIKVPATINDARK